MASSSSSPQWKHSVFLNFRGEDTRNNFVSHLYKALDRYGIDTFKDDVTLQRGQHISLGLLKAIEGSRFAIVVISENYGFSGWCLDELVKIMDCMDSMGQTVIPIFYRVDPCDVENQSGTFAQAFSQHQKSYKDNMLVQSWRDALAKVASISGWDSRHW
ncbi:hypothetical protein Tsubulata_015356 [Turnera subulata]|uniref:ADP-ribosyl cyclase/cyclic ADP-ribose hydrolase n=1 Tax=Turnera subulata TaxID=218843 RepID=A0A9Q0JMH9_9ROSI|nr:hypothetical protein Tsubulata_015356 [Turnera subulata]